MKSSADQLVNDVQETGTTMEDYRRQASSDKARASEVSYLSLLKKVQIKIFIFKFHQVKLLQAVQKAQLAEKAAEDANRTISEAMNSLRNINNQFSKFNFKS